MQKIIPLNTQLQALPEGSTEGIAAFFLPDLNLTLLNDRLNDKDTSHFEAEKIVKDLRDKQHLGFNDWILAPVEKLFLVCDRTKSPCVPDALKNLIEPDWYWASTLDPSVPEVGAFIVDFDDGSAYRYSRLDVNARVLACRVGGPASPSQ